MSTQAKILKVVQLWQEGSATLRDVKRAALPYCDADKFVRSLCPGSTSFEIRMNFESCR